MSLLAKLYSRSYVCMRAVHWERTQNIFYSIDKDTTSVDGLDTKLNINNMDEKKSEPKSFATLLRNSPFVHLGPAENTVVVGKIFEVQSGNAFVDFGGKFHCVCPIPEKNSQDYRRGRKVKLLLKDLELSARFLGASKDITLLEAEGNLLGLLQERKTNPKSPLMKNIEQLALNENDANLKV